MDRPIQKKNSSKKLYFSVLAISLVLLASYIVLSDSSPVQLDKDEIRVGTVQQGEFTVVVVGNGTVISRDAEYVLPKAAGEVTSVEVESGDWVEEGQTLFVFENEELVEEYDTREIGLAEAKAALAAKAFELETQKLQLETAVLQAESAYRVKEEEYRAQKILMENENSPVSILDYRQTEIQTIQLRKIFELEQNRLNNFHDSMKVQLNQYEARLDLAEKMVARLRDRVDNLNLKAKKSGIIQDVDLKPGQRVEVGSVIGVISNPDDVYVRLKVSAVQGHRLKQGQNAVIDVSGVERHGKVVRIDPNVKGTTIDVDIELIEKEANLRSNMFLSGRIIVMEMASALFVEAPSNAIENGSSTMYVLNASGDQAILQKVETGYLSAGKIQVASGLNVGDRVVVSDTTRFRSADSVALR